MAFYKTTGRRIIIIATIYWILAIYQTLYMPGSLCKFLSILIKPEKITYSHAEDEKAEAKKVSTIRSRS